MAKWDYENLQRLQNESPEKRTALLSELSRSLNARLPEGESAKARAAQENELPFLRKFLPAAREDQDAALQSMWEKGSNASPKLRRAAGGGLAVSKTSSETSQDQTLSDTERAALIFAALNWDYNSIYTAAEPYLEIAAEEGAHAGAYQTASNLGASLQTTLEDATPKAKAAADARAAELVGLEIQDDGTLAEATAPQWAISTTAKDDVLAAIKQAIVENWTPQQLEAVIQASVVWTPDHAELIADNEISRQQSGGHLISWRASGKVLEYQWTVQDLGCCPLCAEFAALGPVPVGYEFAPMITAPGAHPLCRCWLTATKYAGDDE